MQDIRISDLLAQRLLQTVADSVRIVQREVTRQFVWIGHGPQAECKIFGALCQVCLGLIKRQAFNCSDSPTRLSVSTWHCPHLLLSAVLRLCAATPLLLYRRPARVADDQYILPARRSAANPPHVAAAVDGTDGRTDGRPCILRGQGQKAVGCLTGRCSGGGYCRMDCAVWYWYIAAAAEVASHASVCPKSKSVSPRHYTCACKLLSAEH